MEQLVITAVGPDRPGLVGALAAFLYEGGVNVADSRMVNLRGQFALLMLVEGSNEGLEKLRATVGKLAQSIGLTVSFAQQVGAGERVSGMPYRLKTYSMDQPGIVAKVSDVLRKHGVNIEELDTRQEPAPFAGGPLFTMELLLTVPSAVPVRTLRKELESVCEALNCDVDLDPA